MIRANRGTKLTPRTAVDQADILVQVDALVAQAFALEENKGVLSIIIKDNGDGTFLVTGRSRNKRDL